MCYQNYHVIVIITTMIIITMIFNNHHNHHHDHYYDHEHCSNLGTWFVMMMMVLCPKAGSLAFTPSGDEMSEVVSRCLPDRQL